MVAISESNLKTSLGALIFGGMVCTGLTGIVAMQTVLYFRLFTRDQCSTKMKVSFVNSRDSLLDLLHSAMIAVANYMYFVSNFGRGLFFALRLFKLSKGNYWITVPISVLAIARVGMIRLGSFYEFGQQFRWVFTLGLVLSSVVDFLITGALCYYLRRNRTGTGRFDHILDSVTLYTVENGLLTSCVAHAACAYAWLVKPHVLIYLGLHFAISKLYANSFLASMNARKILRAQSQSTSGSGHRLPVIFAGRGMRHSVRTHRTLPISPSLARQLTYWCACSQNADQLNIGTRVRTTSEADVGESLTLCPYT
ncbi:hypothetical protein PYCCODRAFT_1446822 [Trametes coccinea BRFM310]|uniref:DUF6534 domain-containing protein n=1 Tax=Trametes coccinea (strain BRFM310) TaxID=1353009 RepID=A0A1Y2IE33_TRAC3|nr:hypothetical protein PYCCODRAFT_1446822 [Trametes coccinea BRFM310]